MKRQHFSLSLLLAALATTSLCSDASAQDSGCPGEVREDIPPGHVVIQGDIIVPADHCVREGAYATNLWPGGNVPYLFNTNVTPTNQQLMLNAMAEWEMVANVDFRPFAGELDFVLIQDSDGNNSSVGRVGAIQVINIKDWGNHYKIVHELGHCLGYWHEQSRPDQPQNVEINYENVCQDCCNDGPCDSNFDVVGGSGDYGPYDFDSVMHYGQFAFTVNSQPTIEVLPPNDVEWQNKIGQRDHLSEWDILMMSFLYPFSDYVFVDQSRVGSTLNLGTFYQPFVSLALGRSAVPDGGTIWILDSGNYADTGVFSDPVTLAAPIGGVVIGS